MLRDLYLRSISHPKSNFKHKHTLDLVSNRMVTKLLILQTQTTQWLGSSSVSKVGLKVLLVPCSSTLPTR